MIKDLNINEKIYNQTREGKELEFRSGKYAPQSDGSVTVKLGDTTILVTTVMNKDVNEERDFMPLMIDFRESFYAGGKIGGAAFIRREGKPSEQTTINARLTDRPIRPMFPEGMINDTVITITPFGIDKENTLGVPSIIGASLATMISGIPFEGPVGAVKIGYKDGEYIINPTYEQIKEGELDITVAGTEDTITMVECGSKESSTEIIIKGIEIAKEEIKKVCKRQKEFLKNFEIEEKEIKISKPSEDTITYIKQFLTKDKLKSLLNTTKKEFNDKQDELEKEILELTNDKIEDENNNEFTTQKVKSAVFKIIKEFVRENIIENETRVDGRKLDEIRPIYSEVGTIPRLHGLGLFQRGETQVFSACTLGAPGDVQLIDDMEYDLIEKRFIHHYNMPGFSNNEPKGSRAANRREIGHGKLAEKALESVIPSSEEFPYTIRIVSEVLSSNGSTSMASVCASTLSLMDAGVPIKDPVSGIAMGLVTDEKGNYKILSDIQGVEDFTGDMDFKVAGTRNGITALQMDMKIRGLSIDIIKNAIEIANKGREEILKKILNTLSEHRKELSIYAPKITKLKLTPTQVREVIGSGGSTINDIVKKTGVKIDFQDDGTTIITAKNSKDEQEAIKMINEVTWTPSTGDIIEGSISRVENYGVFVNLGNNKVGLCHVKNLSDEYISDPKIMYKEEDKIRVKILSVDNDGKIQLKKEA